MTTINQVLSERFGFAEFRPGQAEVIGFLLEGRSAAAVFPTGSGKSLCYQLPALVLDGVTLVVSPLIALMKDQIDSLTRRGIAAARIDSTLSVKETADVMLALHSGDLKMLYVAPERFNNERFREAIRQIPVALMTIDEAHCISEWGHNFRPDYLKLARYAKLCNAGRILALTATATPPVLADICRTLGIREDCAVRTGFYRPNLTLLTTPVVASDRNRHLVERLHCRQPGPAIVYVTLQRTAEDVAQHLSAAGFNARPYHAGMPSEARAEIQNWFEQANDAVIVATIAFGMGIDRANIRSVIHYNVAKSLENYCQEIGRAGRDGLPSSCEMFVCHDDLETLEEFARSDTPKLDSLVKFVTEVFSLGELFHLSIYDLAKATGIRPLVTTTLLTYLELDGFLESGTPFYARYSLRPLVPVESIPDRFDGERRTFIQNILKQASVGRIWLRLDLEKAAEAVGSPRDRILRALGYLEAQSLIELKAESIRNRYHRLKQPENLDVLAASLHQRAVHREQRELERLRQVMTMASSNECRSFQLARHFGEERHGQCGHCSWCLSQ